MSLMETPLALNKGIVSLSLEDKDEDATPLVLPNESKNRENRALSISNPDSQKRGRLLINLEDDDDEQPQKKKNIKIDNPVTNQWISVLTSRPFMKQRYLYNVVDSRLHHLIKKANKVGFFISCVASEANRWALIVDSGTGFTSQVYKLSSAFIHKEWILEQWRNDYYISSIAGANNGSSVIVMSKGTPYTRQVYKVSDSSLPFKWIHDKWKQGFHVTSMATASNSRWCIVMSMNAGYSKQVVEFDSFYPSERINERWKSGYRITSMGATTNQVAFIMSIPKQKITDEEETQETIHTSANFPSTHLKKKWRKNTFVSLICYGRTKNGSLGETFGLSLHSDDHQCDDDVHNALAALHISDENLPQSGTNKVMVADENCQPITHIDSVTTSPSTQDVLLNLIGDGGTGEEQTDKKISNVETNKALLGDEVFLPVTHIGSVALPSTTSGKEDKTRSNIEKST